MVKTPAIRFIFPNFRTGSLIYHLGVNYIIAYLRSKGIYAEQFVMKERVGSAELTRLILERQPRIIGFTCFDENYYLVKLLSRQIKMTCSDVLIIAGGPTATFSDKKLLKDIPEINVCVRGEGEYTTFELIEHLKNNNDFGGIEGITYRKKGNIIRNQDRPFIKNEQDKCAELDIIPSPYLTGVLDPEDFLNKNDQLTILTSRGCVYRCAYCNFSAMSKHTVRYHSIDRVIAELKVIAPLREKGREFKVVIMDDTFTFNRKRVKELCERIIKEDIRLDFSAGTRGDCLNKKLPRLLFDAGIRVFNFGLESAVPRILYAMKKVRRTYGKKKGFIPEKRYIQNIKDNVKLAKKIGFKISTSVIFGFPGETFKEGLKTLNFVNRLKVDRYSHNRLYICPGTELFESTLTNTGFRSCKPIKKKQYSSPFQRSSPFFSYPYSEYNLNRLPILYNEGSFTILKDMISYFLTPALMGVGKKVNFNYPEYVILVGDIFPFKWLEQNLAFQTKIVFGKNIHRFINHMNGNIKIAVRPFAQILSLLSVKGGSRFKSKRLHNGSIYPINNYSFLKLALLNKLSNSTSNNKGVIFDMCDNEDVRELQRQPNLNSIFGFHAKVPLDCVMLDGCRWSSNCPASQMKRLIVDDEGDMRTCFQGEVIGNIDIPLKEIQKKLISLIKKTESERGCNYCPARDRCSKCVFLGSIAPEKYCSIMKTQPNIINRFINSLSIARTAKCSIDIRKRII